LTKLEGINPDESVFHSIRCRFEDLWGELVVTDRGVVFLKFKGVLGKGRDRLHQFSFSEIQRVQTEKKRTGIFRHGIVIDLGSKSSEGRTFRYECEQYKARLFVALFERQKLLLQTPEEIKSRRLSRAIAKGNTGSLNVVKVPRMKFYLLGDFIEEIEAEILDLLESCFEADLFEISTNEQLRALVARLHGYTPGRVPQELVYFTVTDLVTHLILRGELKGIVTDAGNYISNEALARINVPFELLADFETIHTQLKDKGLLIWTLDCPSCFKKIKYPKEGKEIACPFCSTVIPAKDVFTKFKDLL
jgi:hypothetical protein